MVLIRILYSLSSMNMVMAMDDLEHAWYLSFERHFEPPRVLGWLLIDVTKLSLVAKYLH